MQTWEIEQTKDKIRQENKARRILNEIVPKMKNLAREHTGEYVYKKNDTLTERFRKLLKIIEETITEPQEQDLRYTIQYTTYSTALYVSINMTHLTKDGIDCYNQSAGLCEIRNQVITEVREYKERPQIKPEEQIELITQYEEAQEKADIIRDYIEGCVKPRGRY